MKAHFYWEWVSVSYSALDVSLASFIETLDYPNHFFCCSSFSQAPISQVPRDPAICLFQVYKCSEQFQVSLQRFLLFLPQYENSIRSSFSWYKSALHFIYPDHFSVFYTICTGISSIHVPKALFLCSSHILR